MTGLFTWLEVSGWRRDPRLGGLILATAVGLGVVTATTTAADIAQREAQLSAAAEARAEWAGHAPANPHGMAHYGDFAFRPSGALARLDQGVQARLGKVVRMEGHRQGTPLHADAARAGSLARFPRPDPAFLLHTVVPLLLVFLGGSGLAADRDAGRLKLALVQGASAWRVLTGHALAIWGLGLTLLGLVVVTSLGTSAGLGEHAPLPTDRLTAFVGIHAAYLGLVATGVVAAAVWFRDARAALLSLLGAWVVATAVLPRATAGVASVVYPLPSQDAFQAQLREARAAGPDGHNPEDAELERLQEQVLAEYEVETVDALPINFDGIRMQVDEEFGNRVWDEHYGGLREQMARQGTVASAMAWLNPAQAVDQLSMAVAGTDLTHDVAFQRQVEAHRRILIEKLNHEHAYGGSKTGDWSWNAPTSFFAAFDAFEYHPPGLGDALQGQRSAGGSLAVWGVLTIIALAWGAYRLDRGSLPC